MLACVCNHCEGLPQLGNSSFNSEDDKTAHSKGDWMGQNLIECNYGASSSKTLNTMVDICVAVTVWKFASRCGHSRYVGDFYNAIYQLYTELDCFSSSVHGKSGDNQ